MRMANITVDQQANNKGRLLDHPATVKKLKVLKKSIDRKSCQRRKSCVKTKPTARLLQLSDSLKDVNNNNNTRTLNYSSMKESSLSATNLLEECRKELLVKENSENAKSYERLMLSLQSPFPNEHEFAINVCLVLSAEETKELDVIAREPALLNMLLANAGFYHDCGLRMLMEETFGNAFGKQFSSFWEEIMLPGKEHLLCECYPRTSICDNPEVEKGIATALNAEESEKMNCCSGCRYYKMENDEDEEESEKSYYCPCDKIGKRIQQVGQVLRNFSFDQGNAKVMASSRGMLKFLLASVHADFGSLPQIAFDIISNISSFIKFNQGDDDLDKLISELFDLVGTTIMSSNDRFKILCSLQSLQLLIKEEENREMILGVMSTDLCKRIFDLLLLSLDAALVVNCIEYIFAMTEVGADSCNALVSVHGSLGILVSVITARFTDHCAEDFKFTVLDMKPENEEVCSIEACHQQRTVRMLETPPEFLSYPCGGFYTALNGKTMQSTTVVPMEPVLVHPIHHRYNSLRDVAAVVYGTPSDDKPIINGYLKTLTRNGISEVVSMHQRIVLPVANNSVFGNNKLERTFTLQTDNPKQNTVTLTFTGLPATPTTGSQKLLSEDELDNVIPYLCEWGDCKSRFLEKKQLRWHFYQTHCPKNGFTEKLKCLWRGKHSSSSLMSCQSPRSIFSLMSHLEEHYSDTALEAALHKRKNKMETSDAVPGVNLVQEALKQVSATQMETMPEKEDDLTKSIRLTAALALRNLAKDSFEAKRSLKHHESHFVEVAMRGLECSGAISQLLYYLNE